MDLNLRQTALIALAILALVAGTYRGTDFMLARSHAQDNSSAAAMTASEIGIAAAAAVACDPSAQPTGGSLQVSKTFQLEGQSVTAAVTNNVMNVTVGTGKKGFSVTEPVGSQCQDVGQTIDVGGGQ